MTKSDVKSYYLSQVTEEAKNLKEDYCLVIPTFANRILEFVLNYPDIDNLKELDFNMIKDIVKSNDKPKITYTLHLLALEPHKVLNWIFYTEDEDERYYFKTVEMAQILQDKTYFNPLTGKEVSKEEFSMLVNTVFGLSEEFKLKIKCNREMGLH